MNNDNDNNTDTTTNKRTRGPGSKDFTIAFFTGGVEGVREKAEENDTARVTLEKSSAELQAIGQDVTQLNAMILEMYGEKGEGRGRTPASIGEIRGYKVQQVKDGEVFIKLPVSLLNVLKGNKVQVYFKDGHIVVK